MAEQCAVVGIGQTHHKKKRADVSIPGLLREAATRALEDAECTWGDIDAVVIGKAPDAFEGIVQPELFLADALGGAGKPMLRVHTAGSVGGSTFIVGSHLIESGIHERVLAVAGRSRARATRSGVSPGDAAEGSVPVARSRRGSARTSSARARPSTSDGKSR
jgi:acetyl-CoA C-acetyltransferase